MIPTDKPVFVFVPGAWHTADTFDQVRQLMLSRGLASEAISLPSVGGPLEKGLHADIEYTKIILREMADAGRQIVVVNHSYGGMVGSGAVEGLGFKQRADAGLPGGVIMVVWMAAFVTPKGQTVLDQLGGNWLPWMIIKNPDDGYCWSSSAEQIFYHDMSPEEQQKAIAKLQPQPQKSFNEPAVHEPWHEMPSMFLFCDQDQALPLAVQENLAKNLVDPVTYHVDGSHSAFLSVPEQVIDGLELALKEGQQRSEVLVN
ncbi:unnamed protein product [Penicillium salamii]|uniref:AB hydrolase-1 domain-containing protein n=1 Tax=Penicillium salamii TaxID=1612424 RepID=A0A9W4N8H7_9EURO|nr:unnamed protein product [Penicillium salamii]CAG8004077.1 unnamed protein product [Penicillium salamii]CAG8215375.1 unnamed protein product [Penicillium salamii]CAG8300716.1 unnamed protein product [Penicillium salamii]CAG8324863.1 unnamed protein product [Penicillium salamii]